jgi:hypothetical protein
MKIGSFAPFWTSLPFAELGGRKELESFSADTAASYPIERSYAPEAGLAFEREPVSEWWDLLIPAALRFAFRRELSTKGVEVRDDSVLEAKLDFAALELFGSRGAVPIFRQYASDEYRLTFQGSTRIPATGNAPSWVFLGQGNATLLGDSSTPGNKLVADDRTYLSIEPAALSWSQKLGIDFSRQVERSWLLDAWVLLSRNLPKTQRQGAVSTYLSVMSGWEARARTILSVDAEISGSRTDSAAPPPDLKFSEYWETRITIPERLSAWVRFTLAQAWLGSTGSSSFGASLGAGLTLSF